MPRIIELYGENFKRLRAVTIRPDGNVVVLNGPNGSGKSSALDAIWAALGGKDAAPEVPIREGERKAVARIRLDSGLTVESTWTAAGGRRLKVYDTETEELVRSPQAILATLCSKHTIDPLQFARMKRVEQRRNLQAIVGLDFEDLETEYRTRFAERTELKRDLGRLRNQLASLPPHDPDVPAVESSIADLTATWKAAQDAVRDLERRAERLQTAIRQNEGLEERIAELEGKLDEYRKTLIDRQQWIETEHAALLDLRAEAPNVDGLSVQLEALEATNAKVRANAQRAIVAQAVETATLEVERLTATLASIDEAKAERLAHAEFPVPGLGFDEDGITFNGLPFEQASDAERVRVSTAIGLALRPGLKVLLIRDAEKLDAGGMKLIADLATEHDAQLWLERAGHNDPGAIVFEAGEVVSA